MRTGQLRCPEMPPTTRAASHKLPSTRLTAQCRVGPCPVSVEVAHRDPLTWAGILS